MAVVISYDSWVTGRSWARSSLLYSSLFYIFNGIELVIFSLEAVDGTN